MCKVDSNDAGTRLEIKLHLSIDILKVLMKTVT